MGKMHSGRNVSAVFMIADGIVDGRSPGVMGWSEMFVVREEVHGHGRRRVRREAARSLRRRTGAREGWDGRRVGALSDLRSALGIGLVWELGRRCMFVFEEWRGIQR